MAGLVTGESIVNPDQKLQGAGIKVITGKAVSIDVNTKKVYLDDGTEIPYDKLIMGTGASPIIPPMEGHDLKGVLTLRSLSDAETIKHFLEDKKLKKLAFIGAGFITLEVAALLKAAKPDYYDIHVIELLSHPLPMMMDKDLAVLLQEYLVEKGMEMNMGAKVEKILGQDGTVTGVELSTGEIIAADMVFLNVGARANTELAKDIGLEIGRFGIRVNKFLETSNPDILAAGDCVEKEDFITKKPVPGQLRGPAVIQGRLAAKRLAGYKIEFPGVLNAWACKLFDKVLSGTGLTEEQALQADIETVSAVVDSRSKHGMIPGVKPWTIKLIFDKDSRKLIGGQIISDAVSPAKEIDAVSALILGGKTIEDLTTFMTAGNPDSSSEPSMEPITIAAEQALQKLRT